MIKFTVEQMERVRRLQAREGHAPLATYLRQLVLARASAVLHEDG